MPDLYLIAHKVRGEPAFDIAQHMTCPACEGTNDHCVSCDGAGHWWIIPTSGHRAWPIMTWPLKELVHRIGQDPDWDLSVLVEAGPLEFNDEFVSVRDHYTTVAE